MARQNQRTTCHRSSANRAQSHSAFLSDAMTDEIIYDACIADPVQNDLEMALFSLWLRGWTANECFLRKKKELAQLLESKEDTRRLEGEQLQRLVGCMERDCEDQFRVFSMLEHYFRRPLWFATSCIVQLSAPLKAAMLEAFYEFDPIFIRQLLGVKLSRAREDVMELSSKVGVIYTSALRQFENLKCAVCVCRDFACLTTKLCVVCSQARVPRSCRGSRGGRQRALAGRGRGRERVQAQQIAPGASHAVLSPQLLVLCRARQVRLRVSVVRAGGDIAPSTGGTLVWCSCVGTASTRAARSR